MWLSGYRRLPCTLVSSRAYCLDRWFSTKDIGLALESTIRQENLVDCLSSEIQRRAYNLTAIGDEGFRQGKLAKDCKPRYPTLAKQGQLKITGEPQLAMAT